jgi:hypothetical protein
VSESCKVPLAGGAKSMKPNGHRLIRHESDETFLASGAVSYLPFRITGQGVPGNGKVKGEEPETIAKASGRR